jgi:peptidoglycan/LPS O-acetylase OafA/YrhL
MRDDKWQPIAAAGMIAVFLAVMWFGKLRVAFNWPLFTYFGAISYPLYLFHENAGIATIIKLGRLQVIPAALLPVVVLAVMAAIAHLIASRLEPAVRGMLVLAPQPKMQGRRPPA